jgi:hypothetical protein
MVLTSRNAKVLSGKYARDREEAALKRDNFTADELSYLDVAEPMGHGQMEEDGQMLDIVPADPNSKPQRKAADRREVNKLLGG